MMVTAERERNSFHDKLHGLQSRHPQAEESLTIKRIRERVGQDTLEEDDTTHCGSPIRGPDAGAAP